MKLSIQPTTFLVPGKGNVVANLLEVRVAGYELGQGASAFYDLQKRTVTPAVEAVPAVTDEEGNVTTPEVPAVPEQITDESLGLSGNVALTAEQFAAWGKDDDWFTRCIAQNLGLFPTSND